MQGASAPLVAEQLCVTRGGHEVLQGISFSVSAGEVYALLGGNGVGKSTTLLTFLGFLETRSGKVLVNDVSVENNVTATRQAIAYLPESAALYPHMDAIENLTYFLQLAGKDVDAAGIHAAVDRVNLSTSARQQRLSDYSKGMRQKVAIAMALLRDTQILLLDEPTSGLDPVAIDEFHELVRGLADDGRSVLMVTHDVYGACQVADRIGLLRNGKIVGEFTAPTGGSIDTEAVHSAFSSGENA
ncbi:MAG: ABC transporter ATP-binding protein [Pseudomonadota bacterium]